MNDEYLTRCVIDPISRKVHLFSNEGSEKENTRINGNVVHSKMECSNGSKEL